MTPVAMEDLDRHFRRRAAAHLSCEPADRPAAEECVRSAYKAAELAPPERIVWCGGPVEIARQLAEASKGSVIGRSVKGEIYDHLKLKTGTLAEIFWKETLVAAAEAARRTPDGAPTDVYERYRQSCVSINRVVAAGVGDRLFALRVRARHLLLRLRGVPRVLPERSFEDIAIGPSQIASLGVYEYLHETSPWTDVTRPLRGLWRLGAFAGWIAPYRNVCWISERPSLMHTDAKGRLHCANGAALRYRDGWAAYVWKGTPVQDWMIVHPERITCAAIDATLDPVLRNCMIEIMTPERFVKSGAPTRVAEDDCGILWRKFWSHRGVVIGSWAAVEVVDGTPGADGTRKHYFLRVPSRVRTAREAVAWTYGLTEKEYARLEVRT